MRVDSTQVSEATLRPALANADSESIIVMMLERGWGFEGEIRPYEERHRYLGKFTKWEWLGVPLGCALGYGYLTPALDALEPARQAGEILKVVRRAAELALRVEETFTETLPRTNGLTGEVEPESPAFQAPFQESRRKFADPAFVASRKDRIDNRVFEDPDERPILRVDRDFFKMDVQGREVLLTDGDIERLERGLEMFRMKKLGKMAI